MSRVGANGKRARLARRLGRTERQVACGLESALWEVGPNHLTEFADALQFEGKPKVSGAKQKKWEALGRFRDELTRFLADKKAAFIGGVAVRSYGGRTTPTIDYDVLIDSGLLKPMTRILETLGGSLQGTVEETYHFYIAGPEIDLDVRVARTSLDQEALATRKQAAWEGRRLGIVTPKALAAMKVKAYSERKKQPEGATDRADVKGLIAVGATTEQEVRRMLKKHRPDLLPELDEILAK